MKTILLILVVCFGLTTVLQAQQSRSQESPEQTELWQLYQQISDLTALEQEVPSALYDRYFELDRLVNPGQYEGREQPSTLDQLNNICPGGLIVGPDSGMTYMYSTTGATNSGTNNCSYPNCRLGRDLFLRLEVRYRDSVTVTTCGSSFDTYLCISQGGCCGDSGSVLWDSNNNAPHICGVSTTLHAGISRCFEPGIYYICLDGTGPSAFGQYRFSIIFHGNSCIPPITDPECPADFAIHEESFPEGCDDFANTIHCNQGFCGQIDQQGDLDVFALTIDDCEREVTISVWADDSPGRTGFEGGLNSHLRIWPVTCEAPLAVNDDFNGNEGSPIGTDSQVTISLVPGTYFFEITGSQATSGPYEMFVACSSCDQ